MIYAPIIIFFVLVIILLYCKLITDWKTVLYTLIISLLIDSIIVYIDFASKVQCTEIWSGKIINVQHKEEWDKYIPPKTETYTETKKVNGKNKTITKTRIIPGYWKHYPSENWIETTDEGKIFVYKSPDGIEFNDSYPNKTEELYKYWKIGDPSASIHSYVNKVQASYSLYKHSAVNLNEFKDLPEYPSEIKNYINIERIIGYVPNKEKAEKLLSRRNSELNKLVPDKDNPNEFKTYKQVNIMFVNVGENKNPDYGFALQDYWKNGNKNDFIISFSMNKDNKINWVYVFSWSESELLKIHVRDYMLNLKNNNDFTTVVSDVSNMVEKEFQRKEFKDFNYLQIPISNKCIIIMSILNIIILVIGVYNDITKGFIKYEM